MSNKIIIAIQLCSFENYNIIINSLLQYDTPNNLFLISVLNSLEKPKHIFTNQIITTHKNIGMDIGPFLLQLMYIFDNNLHHEYTHIYKIHSKSNKKWLKELLVNQPITDHITCNNKWSMPLDHYNRSTIIELCSLLQIPNIYYDDLHDIVYDINNIDIDFYESYYNISVNKTYQFLALEYILLHAKMNNHALNQSQIKIQNRKNIMFVAGTIFISSMEHMCNLFLNKDLHSIYCMLESGYVKNDRPTYVHALERIISGHYNGL